MQAFHRLKPCPFCGGEAADVHVYAGESVVHCAAMDECLVHPSVAAETPQEAADAWNSRVVAIPTKDITFPVFEDPGAARKWGELQQRGYRMRSINFEGLGRIGSITTEGYLNWDSYGDAEHARMSEAYELGRKEGIRQERALRALSDEGQQISEFMPEVKA